MKRALFIVFCILLGAASASTQNVRLANQYFSTGEYEKAAEQFQKLYADNPRNEYYFRRYVDCVMNMEAFDRAERTIKEAIKERPKDIQLYVSYGELYDKQNMPEKAKKQYRKAIDRLKPQRGSILQLGNAFLNAQLYELALEVYQKGAELLDDEYVFSYNMADLYRRMGNTEKMIEQYLNSMEQNKNRGSSIQSIFQRYLSKDEYDILKKKLYAEIQEHPDATEYIELMQWVYLQQGDYNNALRQAKALDRRLEENGSRVYELAQTAEKDGAYEAAVDGYEYILDNKPPQSGFYVAAKQSLLNAKREQIAADYKYTDEELEGLAKEYESFFEQMGKNPQTASVLKEYANLQAFYMQEIDSAIQTLETLIDIPNVNKYLRASAKLDLGDLYLMKGNRWEATLLYSQVDKEFPEELLGERARFRNAKLSYYVGDFEWAQEQFDILKAATSKLISNDAIDRSVFIMDNLGLDTTEKPLQMYADAELLVFQNRFDAAINKMDSLMQAFPDHGLLDDVLYLKGQLFKKKREYDKSAEMFSRIVEEYPDEIRADNALFRLAELYEGPLGDESRAMKLYEQLFIDFSSSTLAVEARKRYRKLRGDTVQ